MFALLMFCFGMFIGYKFQGEIKESLTRVIRRDDDDLDGPFRAA